MTSIEENRKLTELLKKRSKVGASRKLIYDEDEFIMLAKSINNIRSLAISEDGPANLINSSTYTVTSDDNLIVVQSEQAVITLPSSSNNSGKQYKIKNNTGGEITVISSSPINGSTKPWTILPGTTFCVASIETEYIII